VSAMSHGAGCGVVLGIVLVIFLQQVGYLVLSDIGPTIEYLVIGAVIGGILGALIGWVLGRGYLAHHEMTEATAPK